MALALDYLLRSIFPRKCPLSEEPDAWGEDIYTKYCHEWAKDGIEKYKKRLEDHHEC